MHTLFFIWIVFLTQKNNYLLDMIIVVVLQIKIGISERPCCYID